MRPGAVPGRESPLSVPDTGERAEPHQGPAGGAYRFFGGAAAGEPVSQGLAPAGAAVKLSFILMETCMKPRSLPSTGTKKTNFASPELASKVGSTQSARPTFLKSAASFGNTRTGSSRRTVPPMAVEPLLPERASQSTAQFSSPLRM